MSSFDYSRVKDPLYFREGRLDAHSDHVYYRGREDMISGKSEYTESQKL